MPKEQSLLISIHWENPKQPTIAIVGDSLPEEIFAELTRRLTTREPVEN